MNELRRADGPLLETEIVKAGFEVRSRDRGAVLSVWAGDLNVALLSWRPPSGWKPLTGGPLIHRTDDFRAWLDDVAATVKTMEKGDETWETFKKTKAPREEAVYAGVHAAHLLRVSSSQVFTERVEELKRSALEAANLLWALEHGKARPDDPDLRRVNQEIYTVLSKLGYPQ